MFHNPDADVERAAPPARTAGGGGGGAEENRWQYLVALATISVLICYADRSNISTAILPMSEQYGWDKAFQGVILSSFFFGYALTQLLGGTLADRYGGKAVLAFGVSAWSVFTFLTPQAAAGGEWHGLLPSPFLPLPLLGRTVDPARAGATTLLACRVLMGVGEGVAFPSIHSLIARHVPPSAQSTSVGIATAASYAGTAVAFGTAPWLISSYGWPWVFYTFGLSAALWLPFWLMMEVPGVAARPRTSSDPEAAAAAGKSAAKYATPLLDPENLAALKALFRRKEVGQTRVEGRGGAERLEPLSCLTPPPPGLGHLPLPVLPELGDVRPAQLAADLFPGLLRCRGQGPRGVHPSPLRRPGAARGGIGLCGRCTHHKVGASRCRPGSWRVGWGLTWHASRPPVRGQALSSAPWRMDPCP